MASPFDEPIRPGVVRARLGVLGLGVLVVAAALAGSYWYLRHGGFTPVKTWAEKDLAPWPSWMPSGKQEVAYTLEKKPEVNHVSTPARDLHAEAITQLRQDVRELKQSVEALKNRPAPAPPAPAPAAKPAPAKIKVTPPDSLVLYAYEPPKEADLGTGLSAGTVVNVSLKTRVNSERQRVIVAEVREHLRDSRNPDLILMPQFSKVILEADPQNLITGQERVDIQLARIELPNRQTIELPKEPVTDQIGQGGLTGTIDRKWRYVIPALLFRGVYAASVASITNVGDPALTALQANALTIGQKVTQPYIDSRPNIVVPEGERAAIIITKDLALPVYRF